MPKSDSNPLPAQNSFDVSVSHKFTARNDTHHAHSEYMQMHICDTHENRQMRPETMHDPFIIFLLLVEHAVKIAIWMHIVHTRWSPVEQTRSLLMSLTNRRSLWHHACTAWCSHPSKIPNTYPLSWVSWDLKILSFSKSNHSVTSGS